jgi:hypothetical protein
LREDAARLPFLKGQEPDGKRYTRRMHQMSVTENDAARQVNTANLRQWQAVLAADEWQRAWEALAEPEDERAGALPVEPCTARCDACGREADLEEMVQGRDCTLFCSDCRDVRTDGGWVPEEWGFDGEGDEDGS